MRCCKDLGIASELWDPQVCVCVCVCVCVYNNIIIKKNVPIIVPVKTFEGNVVQYEGNISNISIAHTHTDFYKFGAIC